MKKLLKISLALFISITCLISLFNNTAYAASKTNSKGEEVIKATTTKSNGLPYYVMVNRLMNTVTVYTLDDNGYYTVPYKAFICSTGREGHRTPLGTFKMGTNQYRWRMMVDNSYAQYACGIYKGYMFHSVCYNSPHPYDLITKEYDMLGDYASLGCVRLQTKDAKWIYENCKPGTIVTIYESENPGALGKPEKDWQDLANSIVPTWDPTDPDQTNPWHTYWNAIEQINAALAANEETAGN